MTRDISINFQFNIIEYYINEKAAKLHIVYSGLHYFLYHQLEKDNDSGF